MNITTIASKKIEFLHQHLSKKSLLDFQVFFRKICKIQLVDYLFIDLSYCLLKHLPWLDVAVYRTILVSFLVDYYRLEGRVASGIVDCCCQRLRLNCPTKLPFNDRDFVSYIFVMTLTSKSEQHLVLELGFGSLFLARVRDFLQAVVNCRRPENFLHGFEALCYQSLVELANELVDSPENLALHRLRYQLLSVEWPGGSLSTVQLRSIFALLLHLAEQPATDRQLRAFVGDQATKVVTLLAEQDIIYRSDYRHRSVIWCLTVLGRQLVEISGVKNTRRSRTVRSRSTVDCSSP